LKSIVFMVCQHKYMNIRSPNYRAGGATAYPGCFATAAFFGYCYWTTWTWARMTQP
jgi:hypothetical protein